MTKLGPGLLAGHIVFPLARETNVIGRTDRGTGVYPDIDISPLAGGPIVSRRHAQILHRGGALFVRDAGSLLGTLVNGEPIGDSERELNEGDSVTIADLTLRFSMRCEWPAGEESIVGSAVQMAQELGMTVVAEGVEDGSTARFLLSIGCEKGQGYFFGKPAPRETLDLAPRPVPST